MGTRPHEIIIPQRDTYTYADYALLPEGAPYQLIGGELILTPAPTTFHQIVSMRLENMLVNFVTERGLGLVLDAPVDVYLEEKETYQPDIIFISRDRLDIVEKARVNGAPDLVVEILSPSTAYYDMKKKARVYARHGVREYWLVDPEERSIEVYRGHEGRFLADQRVEGDGTVRSLVLEGLEVDAARLFAPIK
ncbi:MAG: Uma2 family endonuclease [Firmicutes bacterium]|nr:Uma2 family endonuclease [Bacillota bacterium]